MRTLGSAALNMCMVAVGSVDGYYHQGMHCWDIAAGDLIVQEARGVTIDAAGDRIVMGTLYNMFHIVAEHLMF